MIDAIICILNYWEPTAVGKGSIGLVRPSPSANPERLL